MKTHRVDAAAIGVSGLCLAHCLALPLFASFLPIFGALAENELIHKALVLAALPIFGLALVRSESGRDRNIFAALATIGILLLVAGAFVHALHDFETPLTIFGALFLAGAHIFRWKRHASFQSSSFLPEDHLS